MGDTVTAVVIQQFGKFIGRAAESRRCRRLRFVQRGDEIHNPLQFWHRGLRHRQLIHFYGDENRETPYSSRCFSGVTSATEEPLKQGWQSCQHNRQTRSFPVTHR